MLNKFSTWLLKWTYHSKYFVEDGNQVLKVSNKYGLMENKNENRMSWLFLTVSTEEKLKRGIEWSQVEANSDKTSPKSMWDLRENILLLLDKILRIEAKVVEELFSLYNSLWILNTRSEFRMEINKCGKSANERRGHPGLKWKRWESEKYSWKQSCSLWWEIQS